MKTTKIKAKRTFAFFVDVWIGIALYGCITGIAIEVLDAFYNAGSNYKPILILYFIFAIPFLSFYFAILDTRTKGGLGKRIMNLCVQYDSGEQLDFRDALKRGFYKSISLPFIPVYLGYCLNKDGLTFYDKILHTVVVARA